MLSDGTISARFRGPVRKPSEVDLAGSYNRTTVTAFRAASAGFEFIERHLYDLDTHLAHQLQSVGLNHMIALPAADAQIVPFPGAVVDRIEPVTNHGSHWNIL